MRQVSAIKAPATAIQTAVAYKQRPGFWNVIAKVRTEVWKQTPLGTLQIGREELKSIQQLQDRGNSVSLGSVTRNIVDVAIGTSCIQTAEPNTRDAGNGSPQPLLRVVYGVPRVADGEMQHERKNGGVAKVVAVRSHHEARRKCSKGGNNQNPHNRKGDSWWSPRWHGPVIESARFFALGNLFQIRSLVVQGVEDSAPQGHRHEQDQNGGQWNRRRINPAHRHGEVEKREK
mmetsp:Transcript_76341/g.153299  ORF Transcript_76341/g.153299 Transcript_76341/m.153299 type:complete len:231 (-) Transcript_76341:178-870(-)